MGKSEALAHGVVKRHEPNAWTAFGDCVRIARFAACSSFHNAPTQRMDWQLALALAKFLPAKATQGAIRRTGKFRHRYHETMVATDHPS